MRFNDLDVVGRWPGSRDGLSMQAVGTRGFRQKERDHIAKKTSRSKSWRRVSFGSSGPQQDDLKLGHLSPAKSEKHLGCSGAKSQRSRL